MGQVKIQKRILVVTSDSNEMSIIKELLNKDKSVVLSASNGRAALDILRGTDVDVIVSEVGLPIMDGSTLHSICRSQTARTKVPFIFFTDTSDLSITRDPNTFVLCKAKGIHQLAELIDTFG